MKTYSQFFEDIESRRQELRQRQLDQMARFKEKAREHSEVQRQRRDENQERESLKSEIKRELRTGR